MRPGRVPPFPYHATPRSAGAGDRALLEITRRSVPSCSRILIRSTSSTAILLLCDCLNAVTVSARKRIGLSRVHARESDSFRNNRDITAPLSGERYGYHHTEQICT